VSFASAEEISTPTNSSNVARVAQKEFYFRVSMLTVRKTMSRASEHLGMAFPGDDYWTRFCHLITIHFRFFGFDLPKYSKKKKVTQSADH
jgi:hypothetical protein